jgi:hypothetical protein
MRNIGYKLDLKAQSIRTKKTLQDKKDRLFKALDYDPELTHGQLRTRFGYNAATISLYRREWKEARA